MSQIDTQTFCLVLFLKTIFSFGLEMCGICVFFLSFKKIMCIFCHICCQWNVTNFFLSVNHDSFQILCRECNPPKVPSLNHDFRSISWIKKYDSKLTSPFNESRFMPHPWYECTLRFSTITMPLASHSSMISSLVRIHCFETAFNSLMNYASRFCIDIWKSLINRSW